MTRRLPVLAAPALAAVLAACSAGGGAGGGGEPEVDPKAAYVEAAGAVCTEADAEFAALPAPTTPAEFGPYVARTVAIAEGVQADLAALTPPEDDRARLEEQVLTPFATLVEQGKDWSAQVTAAGADEAKLLPLLGTRPSSAGVDTDYLRSYGLDSCADAVARVG